MRNFQRKFSPTTSFSSYGDLRIGKFTGGFFMALIVVPVLWLMWQHGKTTDDYPKVFCLDEECRFMFKDGTERSLPRSSVPFDEKGVVIKDQIIWP